MGGRVANLPIASRKGLISDWAAVRMSSTDLGATGLIVGARTFPGNSHNGHVLNQQLEQTAILLEGTGKKTPKQVIFDLGYRRVDAGNPTIQIIRRGKYKSL